MIIVDHNDHTYEHGPYYTIRGYIMQLLSLIVLVSHFWCPFAKLRIIGCNMWNVAMIDLSGCYNVYWTIICHFSLKLSYPFSEYHACHNLIYLSEICLALLDMFGQIWSCVAYDSPICFAVMMCSDYGHVCLCITSYEQFCHILSSLVVVGSKCQIKRKVARNGLWWLRMSLYRHS